MGKCCLDPVDHPDNRGSRPANKVTIQLTLFTKLKAGYVLALFGFQGFSLVSTTDGKVEGVR